jgi:hypothetical protein
VCHLFMVLARCAYGLCAPGDVLLVGGDWLIQRRPFKDTN